MNIKNKKQTLFVGLCSILFLGNSPQAFAVGEVQTPPAVQQTRKVTGVVNDAMGPIIGASVKIKGTTTGVATDFDENFSLNVQPGAVTHDAGSA